MNTNKCSITNHKVALSAYLMNSEEIILKYDGKELILSPDQRNMDDNVFIFLPKHIMDGLYVEGTFVDGCIPDWKEESMEVRSDKFYIEDNTACDYEGSGSGAIITIKTKTSVLGPVVHNKEWQSLGIFIPLNCVYIECVSYNHCSCNGAETACDFSGEGDVISPGELEIWMTNADAGPSHLSNSYVEETNQFCSTSNEACREAFRNIFETVTLRFDTKLPIYNIVSVQTPVKTDNLSTNDALGLMRKYLDESSY